MGMSRILIFTIGLLAAMGLPTISHAKDSEACAKLIQEFKDVGFNIQDFLDAGTDDHRELAEAVAWSGGTAGVGSDQLVQYGSDSGSSHRDASRDASTLKFFAGKACGFRNEPGFLSNHKSAYRGEAFSKTPEEALDRIKLHIAKVQQLRGVKAASANGQQKLQSAVDKVPIDSPYVLTETFKYPSFAGELREDAKNKRRDFMQARVMRGLMVLDTIAHKSQKISDLLEKKTQMPLTDEQLTKVSAKFAATLKEFDISEQDEFHVDPASGEMTVIAEQDGGDEHAVTAESIERHLVPEEGLGDPGLKKMVRSELTRIDHLSALMIVNAKVEANRSKDGDVSLKITIDFPKLFKDFPLKDISQFVEK